MKTSSYPTHNQSAMDRAVEELNQRARLGRVDSSDSGHSLSSNVQDALGRFFSGALEFVDNIFSPHSSTKVGRVWQTLSSMPSRHPVPTAILVAGGAWVLWQRRKALEENEALTVEFEPVELPRMNSFTETADRVKSTSQNAVQSLQDAALQAKTAYQETASYIVNSIQEIKDRASNLRDEAQDGLKRAKEFVHDEPVNAITGGAALALGLFFLLKNARDQLKD